MATIAMAIGTTATATATSCELSIAGSRAPAPNCDASSNRCAESSAHSGRASPGATGFAANCLS